MFFVIKMAYFALFCNFFLQRFAHFKKKQYFCTRFRGKMAEWSIASVLKTEVLKGTGGSNPSLSALKK